MAKSLREQPGTTPEQRTERCSKIIVPGYVGPFRAPDERAGTASRYVRRCAGGCRVVKGVTSFRIEKGGGRSVICRACEDEARKPMIQAKNRYASLCKVITITKAKLMELERTRAELLRELRQSA